MANINEAWLPTLSRKRHDNLSKQHLKAHIPVLVKVVRRYVHNNDTKMSCVWSAALSDIPRRKPDKNCAGGASVLCGVARCLLAMVGPVGDVKPRLGLAPSLCCPTNTLLVIFWL